MILDTKLSELLSGKPLSRKTSTQIFLSVFRGQLKPSQVKALLLLLARKGESLPEVAGCLDALRRLERPAHLRGLKLADTAGTGGDGKSSFNASTVAAIVMAGAGAKVAKHGNRSISSHCGSSDLMEALGVRLDAPRSRMIRALKRHSLGYFHAPLYHPVFARVQELRRKLKVRTIFNLLGPLTNPFELNGQLIGVSNPRNLRLFAELLAARGGNGAVCRSLDGFDEITPSASAEIYWIRSGRIRREILDPRRFGIRRTSSRRLAAGSPEKNKTLALAILRGREKGPLRDLVILNAAAGLTAAGVCRNFRAGLKAAADSIDSGRARAALEGLRRLTRAS